MLRNAVSSGNISGTPSDWKSAAPAVMAAGTRFIRGSTHVAATAQRPGAMFGTVTEPSPVVMSKLLLSPTGCWVARSANVRTNVWGSATSAAGPVPTSRLFAIPRPVNTPAEPDGSSRNQAQPRGHVFGQHYLAAITDRDDLTARKQTQWWNADDPVLDATPDHEIRLAEHLDVVEHDRRAFCHEPNPSLVRMHPWRWLYSRYFRPAVRPA